MPKKIPTFIMRGEPVRLTSVMARTLARKARQHGHYNRGHDRVANATAVDVACPLCSQPVRGYAYRGVTVSAALDRAVIGHFEDCPEVSH